MQLLYSRRQFYCWVSLGAAIGVGGLCGGCQFLTAAETSEPLQQVATAEARVENNKDAKVRTHGESFSLFKANGPAATYCEILSRGFETPVTGVVFDRAHPATCGMPLGGIATGCLDLETDGRLGYSTVFNDLCPRGGPVQAPLLALAVGGQTWALATGKAKSYEPWPWQDPPQDLSLDLSSPPIKSADDIQYWGHYPIADVEYQTSAPVHVSLRAWSPFLPGYVDESAVPGGVFEVHLKNATDRPQSGSIALNLPGFDEHLSRVLAPAAGRQEMVLAFDVGDDAKLNIASTKSRSGRMLIADVDHDGRNELIAALTDEESGRGVLLAIRRTSHSWGGPSDGSGKYETLQIDARESGFTAVALGDYDGDGRKELVAATAEGGVYAYKVVNAGKFEPIELRQPLGKACAVTDLCAGNPDDDRRDAVYFTAKGASDAASSAGLFEIRGGEVRPLIVDNESRFTSCSLGDFDGDGSTELAVAIRNKTEQAKNVLRIYRVRESGEPEVIEDAYRSDQLDGGPRWIIAGDFEGAGKDSFIVCAEGVGVFWCGRPTNDGLSLADAWQREILSAKMLDAFSEPYPISPGHAKHAIALGPVDIAWAFHGMRYWRKDSVASSSDEAFADLSAMGSVAGGCHPNWTAEPWEVCGPPAIDGAAMGDLSGDGIADVVFWERVPGMNNPRVVARTAKSANRPLPAGQLSRRTLEDPNRRGVEVRDATEDKSYAVAVLDEQQVRIGGSLGADPAHWKELATRLPEGDGTSGTTLAVDFQLAPKESRVVRFVLGWYAPRWSSGGVMSAPGNLITHAYSRRFNSASQVVDYLAREHEQLLERILSWQKAIYGDERIPGWLADGLVNVLHLITEDAVWGVLPEDAYGPGELFGLNECPRGCPQIECIPCSFYGTIPLVYFYPELTLSTLKGYKEYQFEDGRAPWVFGGCTAGTPPYDLLRPARGYQTVLNGACYVAMVDRQWRATGDDNILAEFWPSLKRCTDFSFSLRPEYGDSQVVAMPTGNADAEWFEAPEPGWRGYVTHAGGVRMAQAAIMKRMALALNDEAYAQRCDQWLEAGAEKLQSTLWNGNYYLNYHEPETGEKSDFIFAYQLDGQWIARFHGLPGVFPRDNVVAALRTILENNVRLSSTGAVNYAGADGELTQVGGYGPYSYFPPELLMLAMTYMYEGQRDVGLELAQRCWTNIVCTQRYAWDAPNIMRGDNNDGVRSWGWDYYQNMMLWALPAAMESQDIAEPSRRGGLVEKVLAAAAPHPSLSDENAP